MARRPSAPPFRVSGSRRLAHCGAGEPRWATCKEVDVCPALSTTNKETRAASGLPHFRPFRISASPPPHG